MGTRVCERCNREFPLDKKYFFVIVRNGKQRFYTSCRECNGVDFHKHLPIHEPNTKTCGRCQRELPCDDSHFYKHQNRVGGRLAACKECMGVSFGVYKAPIIDFINHDGVEVRICSSCRQPLPKTDGFFYKAKRGRDGLAGRCKSCCHKKTNTISHTLTPISDKTCPCCKETMSVDLFNKSNYSRDGFSSFCKKCQLVSNKKIRNTPHGRVVHNLRSRLSKAVRKQLTLKSETTWKLTGCDKQTLLDHLESLFKDGMSWENYGFYGWHIDHIIPCDHFDLTDTQQQKECFHYTNLQPLWAQDNLRKSSK